MERDWPFWRKQDLLQPMQEVRMTSLTRVEAEKEIKEWISNGSLINKQNKTKIQPADRFRTDLNKMHWKRSKGEHEL